MNDTPTRNRSKNPKGTGNLRKMIYVNIVHHFLQNLKSKEKKDNNLKDAPRLFNH